MQSHPMSYMRMHVCMIPGIMFSMVCVGVSCFWVLLCLMMLLLLLLLLFFVDVDFVFRLEACQDVEKIISK